MLTPEQQAQYNALLLKQYKGTLTDEEHARLAELQLLRAAPEAAPSSADIAGLASGLARMADELDRLDADMDEMAGKIGGRHARAEAMTELGERDADRVKKGDHDAH